MMQCFKEFFFLLRIIGNKSCATVRRRRVVEFQQFVEVVEWHAKHEPRSALDVQSQIAILAVGLEAGPTFHEQTESFEQITAAHSMKVIFFSFFLSFNSESFLISIRIL